jgi:putative oxidoreductase
MNSTLILRIAVAIVLIAHSVPGMFNNGVNDFGNLYLNQVGFAPFGVFLAWVIKLSHIVCAILLIANRYVNIAALITLPILIAGIIMVHFKEGWFVVGGGRNGMEFNFLLICVLLSIVYQDKTGRINSNS